MPEELMLHAAELPASLYIHVPFCVRKCLYCDFTSYPYSSDGERGYLAGLEKEMALWMERVDNKRWTLSTVFIGGGTPTCLSPGGLREIIALVERYFNLFPGVEYTVEANPGTVHRSELEALRSGGVNRLSLGAQACGDGTLRTLGRIHAHRQTVQAVRQARQAGFDNINLDVIFGVPGQTLDEWLGCLEEIIALRPEHISTYGLQLEPGTPLCTMVDGGILQPCDEDLQLDMYYSAIDMLKAACYDRYEISNFARPGLECRHNLVYWHNGGYLGLGPAAHSRLGMRRIANEERLDRYLAALARGLLPVYRSEKLTRHDDIFETVFLGLRLAIGLDLEIFRERFGVDLDQIYPGLVERLTRERLLEINAHHLRLTRRGLALANMVMAEFAPLTNS